MLDSAICGVRYFTHRGVGKTPQSCSEANRPVAPDLGKGSRPHRKEPPHLGKLPPNRWLLKVVHVCASIGSARAARRDPSPVIFWARPASIRVISVSNLTKSRMRNVEKHLLAVGPLPPPIDGPSISFQIFCSEMGRLTNTHLEVVDSAPTTLKDRPRLVSAGNFRQALRILRVFCRRFAGADRVLIFGSNNFLLVMVPLLLGMAKIFRKPCFLRAFGGSLDHYYASLARPAQWLLLWSLRRADGLIVQTKLLREFFMPLIGEKVYLAPGYRYLPQEDGSRASLASSPRTRLKLVFVGHVREEKGIFILLHALQKLHLWSKGAIHCDIYGPIYDSAASRFQEELSKTENASYVGVLSPEGIISTLRRYDALVLPSYYLGEGHPGVLIEASMAGIPVITTAFRSIPELVEDRVNGLLVRPNDVAALAEAAQVLARDRDLLARMANNSWKLRHRYDARRVVSLIAGALGIEVKPFSRDSPSSELGEPGSG